MGQGSWSASSGESPASRAEQAQLARARLPSGRCAKQRSARSHSQASPGLADTSLVAWMVSERSLSQQNTGGVRHLCVLACHARSFAPNGRQRQCSMFNRQSEAARSHPEIVLRSHVSHPVALAPVTVAGRMGTSFHRSTSSHSISPPTKELAPTRPASGRHRRQCPHASQGPTSHATSVLWVSSLAWYFAVFRRSSNHETLEPTLARRTPAPYEISVLSCAPAHPAQATRLPHLTLRGGVQGMLVLR